MIAVFIFGGAISAMFLLMLLVYLGERYIEKGRHKILFPKDKKKGRKPF